MRIGDRNNRNLIFEMKLKHPLFKQTGFRVSGNTKYQTIERDPGFQGSDYFFFSKDQNLQLFYPTSTI